MDFDKVKSESKYINANGCCLNVDEQIRLSFAVEELRADLKLEWPVYLLSKVCGVVKDYFVVGTVVDAKMCNFWCSSATYMFSRLPEAPKDPEVCKKLAAINNFFTGEYDSVLYPGTGSAKVVDAELGVKIEPKPITELDRLAYVLSQIMENFAAPKGSHKVVPSGKLQRNEGFSGLSAADSLKLENWLFLRKPQDKEVQGLYERDEAAFNPNCLDSVCNDFPKNSWSIHQDATNTVATLKSHLWPGLYAYHRCNTDIFGFFYFGDGIRNTDLPFMV